MTKLEERVDRLEKRGLAACLLLTLILTIESVTGFAPAPEERIKHHSKTATLWKRTIEHPVPNRQLVVYPHHFILAQSPQARWELPCSLHSGDQCTVLNELRDRGLLAAIAIGRGVTVAPSSDKLQSALKQLVAERANQEFPSQSDKDAVRNLLRTGAFKPTGRNKPASEYLAQAAREGRFPFINNLVDINNYVSLRTGLPISLLDADVVGDTLTLRHGFDGERYVFNAAGQDIDLHGLICACAGATNTPLGNPVKDSIAGKIKDGTTNVVGVIYSPGTGELAELARMQGEVFAELLKTEGQAREVEVIIA